MCSQKGGWLTNMQCDFCSSKKPVYCYLAHEASFVAEQADGQVIQYNSDPHWSACQDCYLVIESEDRHGLARRIKTILPVEIVFTLQHVLFWSGNPRVHGAAHE